MENIINEFICKTKIGESETYYTYKAVIKTFSDKPYQLKVNSRNFKDKDIKIQNNVVIYLKDKNELINEFEYYFQLLKNNSFTIYINKRNEK